MKKSIFILIIISYSLQSFSIQNDSLKDVRLLSIKVNNLNAKIDSLNKLYEIEKVINEKYLQIVDKTNTNLNMNWTPINSFFAALSVILMIISLATILMAFGSRNQVNLLLKEKEKIFEDRLQEKVKNTDFDIQSKFNQIDEIIKEYFNKNKPISPNDKYFMFDMIGELEEIKNFVNQEIKDKRHKKHNYFIRK